MKQELPPAGLPETLSSTPGSVESVVVSGRGETSTATAELLQPKLTLIWPNSPHTFDFFVGANGIVSGRFTIIKNRETQTIDVPFPEGITVEEIEKAWTAQKSAWGQLAAAKETQNIGSHNIEAFAGARLIHIPGKGAIIWYILHINSDYPLDVCVFNSTFKPEKFVKK